MSCPFFSFQIYISPYFFLFIDSPKCLNNEHKDHENSYPDFDFERLSCINEAEFEKDIKESDLPSEMLRLLTMEDKRILPHQEVMELVNLGIYDEKKEVKIGPSLDPSAKKEIIDFLKKYADMFT